MTALSKYNLFDDGDFRVFDKLAEMTEDEIFGRSRQILQDKAHVDLHPLADMLLQLFAEKGDQKGSAWYFGHKLVDGEQLTYFVDKLSREYLKRAPEVCEMKDRMVNYVFKPLLMQIASLYGPKHCVNPVPAFQSVLKVFRRCDFIQFNGVVRTASFSVLTVNEAASPSSK